MKERFLPIGTVIRLKDSDKDIMITSFCVFPTGNQIVNNKEEKAEKAMYEYAGCLYPTGIIDQNVHIVFNHNQIEKIVHMGYESEDHKQFSNVLNANYDEVKKQYENGTLTADKLLGKE